MKDRRAKKLHDMYLLAWKKGCKTTYYLRRRADPRRESTGKAASSTRCRPRPRCDRALSRDRPGADHANGKACDRSDPDLRGVP